MRILHNKYKFKHFLLNTSIKTRLILYFILSVLIPTSILAFSSFSKSTAIITSKMNQLIENDLGVAEMSILQKVEEADDISILISFNSKLQDIFSAEKPATAPEIVGEINALNSILESYYLSNLSNFTDTTLFPKTYMLNRSEYKGYYITDKVFDISEIENEAWYKEFTGISTVVGLDQTHTMLDTIDSIRIARKLFKITDSDAIFSAVLTIDIETSYFNNILESIKASPNSIVFIVDQNNSVILKTENYRNEQAINTAIDKLDSLTHGALKSQDGSELLVSVKSIDKLGWKIVAVSHAADLNKELRSFNKSIFMIIAICGVLAFIMAMLLSGDISKPITQLIKSMATVKDGNFDVNVSYKRNDEFAFLIKNFQTMMLEIQDLINKLYVSELSQKRVELKAKEYELKALQAQINPHFLYNTLDSINWLAIKYRADEISMMVKSLSNFFRYSLSKGKPEITLETEMLQIESYLKIQRIRFKEKLNYSIDFSEEILRCTTIKLILQPLVENAIIHGLEKLKVGGFIRITGCRVESHIIIQISDNGVGADIDQLNSLLTDNPESETSFGIKNVNDRIKQFFGDEYGLSFVCNESGGITAIIDIPFNQ